jgi:hypothetical protein
MIGALIRWVFRTFVSALLFRLLARFFPALGGLLRVFRR